MATYYRWNRSRYSYNSQRTGTTSSIALTASAGIWRSYDSPAFDSKEATYNTNGFYMFEISDGESINIRRTTGSWFATEKPSAHAVYTESTYLTNIARSGNVLSIDPPFDRYEGVLSTSFIDYVYSTSSSAYPNGGVSGSYYYDQRTTVTSPTAPTGLTYPNPITTPTVTVSWNASTSNTSYPVSRYAVYVQVNNSPNIIFSNENITQTNVQIQIPANYNGSPVTSVAIRVSAIDSNGQKSSEINSGWVPVYFAPTLTVPQMVMQGQQATVSWTSIEGADSYTLQRKSSADADWTQVYSGANLSYSETVGTWTSLQYRVQAVFDETPGGWATSDPIQIVSASALVISGQDGDLGTVVNDIPYSISTDTGNQITATITVNSAVIFSGNVGNSTSDTIPVLDLVNGTGTIVIEATVTSGSAPVSAVRTWTYTKAEITFPNAGSVAQLTQEGANIWPKTLAECVRLPGGKTLDEVTAFPCQVYTGSYVGTGTVGDSNPNTLTFPFTPKMVYIGRTNGETSIVMLPYIWGAQYFQVVQTYSGRSGTKNKVTISGNTMQWAIVDDTPVEPGKQLNYSGYIYGFVAVG